MSIKDDIIETKEEVAELKEQEETKHSLAYEIVQDYKKTNNALIITNILLIIALIVAIVL